jgi:hypothetical protein
MQLIYFTIFLITMIAYAVYGLPRQEEEFNQRKEVIATHMTAWHKSAVKRCLDATATPCVSGVVDVTAHLYPSMRNGDAFEIGRFTTRYDATTKMLVTSINPVVVNSGYPSEVVFGALNDMVDGESSMIGVLDRSTMKIKFESLTGIYQRTSIDVPSTLVSGVATGSPVIVTNM